MKKVKKRVFIILGIITALLLFFLFKYSEFYKKIYTPQLFTNVTPIPKEKKEFNIMLMGYGGPGHDGTYLTDTMMMIHIDIKKKTALIMSIPRDLWVSIPAKEGSPFHSKINSAYQMSLFQKQFPNIPDTFRGNQGAGNLVKEVVGTVTGIPIDYYVAIDFDGFRKAVDILDGVDINVARSFDDSQYPIDGHEDDPCGLEGELLDTAVKQATQEPELAFPCRYEPLHFDAGLQHMDGTTALKFVRSRHSAQDGGDFGRASRQQLFLDGIKAKVISIGFIPKIIPLLDELGNHVRTDIPFEVSNKLLSEADNSRQYQITQLILSDKNYLKPAVSGDRQYILIPIAGMDNWDDIKQWIHNSISEITLTVTPMKKK